MNMQRRTKMNKELEIIKQRLNTIRENTKVNNRRIADEENKECIKCIETCLSDIEKSLKALEIIKEKGVRHLSYIEILCDWDWKKYTSLSCAKLYTKSEFNLLKEYLK